MTAPFPRDESSEESTCLRGRSTYVAHLVVGAMAVRYVTAKTAAGCFNAFEPIAEVLGRVSELATICRPSWQRQET